VRTDTTPGAATVGSGNGTSLPEQYVAYTPSNLASTAPVQPGDTAILRSRLTGQFCKLATLPSGKQGMVCDQATAATATVFKYTGSGLEYNNQPLVATGAGQPLVLAGSGASSPTNADPALAFSPVGGLRCQPGMASSCCAPGDVVCIAHSHDTS
jgi:hypothetical protein